MEKERAKYISWTDQERELVRHFVDVAVKAGKSKGDAFEFASKKLGRSANACYGAYHYVPKSKNTAEESIPEEVTETIIEQPKEETLNVKIHNDKHNQCVLIKVNDSVTILKIGEVIVTLEV
jgi:hypothetical protein